MKVKNIFGNFINKIYNVLIINNSPFKRLLFIIFIGIISSIIIRLDLKF